MRDKNSLCFSFHPNRGSIPPLSLILPLLLCPFFWCRFCFALMTETGIHEWMLFSALAYKLRFGLKKEPPSPSFKVFKAGFAELCFLPVFFLADLLKVNFTRPQKSNIMQNKNKLLLFKRCLLFISGNTSRSDKSSRSSFTACVSRVHLHSPDEMFTRSTSAALPTPS